MNARTPISLVAFTLLTACGSSDKPTENTAPASITPTAITGSRQAGMGQPLGDSLEVTVLTSSGAPATGVAVSWAVTAGGGSIAPVSSTTNASGKARARWTLGATKGSNTATATVFGVSTPATFTATGLETFSATLNGANERPNPTSTGATGLASFILSPNGDTVNYKVTVTGLAANASGAHIHGPASADTTAGVFQNLGFSPIQSGTLVSSYFWRDATNASTNAGAVGAVKYDSVLTLMRNGNSYVNVHSVGTYAGGEIRGQVRQP